MKEVVILSAVRTPIGKIGQSLAQLTAVELGTIAAKAAINSAGLAPNQINQVFIGNVLQAGSGQNVARQIALKSQLAVESTATTINQVCGSGIKAVRLGQSAIAMGDATVVLAGGTESMSNVPYLVPHMRQGRAYGATKMLDALEHDGLTDAFLNIPMGLTAENVASQFQISREEQDHFALSSHQKAKAATATHAFNTELVSLTPNDKKIVPRTDDEAIRPDTSLEALSRLKPAFKENGSVTAGNSAGLNDGASMLILMEKKAADAAGLQYLAVIDGYQEIGIDPAIMGYGPYYAVQKLMAKQNRTIEDYDLIELNEAFAAQAVAVARDLKIPTDRLNVNGGAIALGHPVGASGARILTTLIHQLHRANLKTGLATLCVGGGMGVAMSVRLPD